MKNRRKIKKEDIILDALLECLNDYHIRTRKEARESGRTIFNPHYWEQGEFISLDYVDKYNNIVYTVTQPGTDKSFSHHKIGVAFSYRDYKPYHDRWMTPIKRNIKLKELGI